MKRRTFMMLLGAAAWPLAARAQQPATPVIGFLDPRSPDASEDFLRPFRQGLKDTGYVERESVAIEYRWAENQLDRLPELAAELVRHQVTVIVASGGPPSVLAAKSSDHEHPHHLRHWPRSGQAWTCRQSCPAGRQPDWSEFFQYRADRQAVGIGR
jgi:putative tryptophan/tyrosine transport system substrate-binding protein